MSRTGEDAAVGSIIDRAATILAAAVAIVALAGLWGSVRSGWFSPDDFQHAHLAWLTIRSKVIYRDFFDNHGPLYAWTNAALMAAGIRASGTVSFESIVLLRYIAWAAVAGQVIILWRIARRMTTEPLVGLAAAGLWSSSYLVAHSAIKVRPDALLVMFVLLAVLWSLGDRPWLAGAALGAVFALHPKGLAAIAAVLLGALCRDWMAHGARWSWLRRFLPMVAGMGAIIAAEVLVLHRLGALGAFWDQAIRYNFAETSGRITDHRVVASITRDRFLHWAAEDALLVLGGLAGMALLLARHYRTRLQQNPKSMSVLVTSAMLLPVWSLPLYPQASLVTLPFLALLLPLGLKTLDRRLGRACLWLVIVLTACLSVRRGKGDWFHPMNAGSRDFARYASEADDVLRNAGRGEPVLFVWPSVSPAYVFNENPDRLWMLPPDRGGGAANSVVDAAHYETMERLMSASVLGGGIDWVVIDAANVSFLSDEYRKFLENKFEKRGSVWRRRNRPPSEDHRSGDTLPGRP